RDETAAAGGRMLAQAHSRGLNVVLSFKTQLPFDNLPAWKPFRALPLAEQRERLRDPETRRRLIEGAHASPERRALGTEARPFPYEWIFLYDTVAGPHRTVAEIARERGVDPAEAMIDLALERDLERFFVHPVANEDQDAVLEMMRHPRAVVTFSDSGAHVSQIIDSSLQTHLLSHWVRAKQAFTLEQAVRMLTLVPATYWGFADRGLVREGFVADLIVFDPDTISPEMPRSSTTSPPALAGSCNARPASPRRSSTARSCSATASIRARFPGSCCADRWRGGREPRETPDVAQRHPAGAAPRHRAPGSESADGQDGRGRGLSRRISGRRRDRLPEGRARGESQPDRDVPGGYRHPRRLVAPAHPRRRLRLRRPDAHTPDHRHERGGRVRCDRDRGPARPEARASPHRDRAHDPDRADGGQGQGGRRRPTPARLCHHRADQRDAGQHDGRRAPPWRSLPEGRGRRRAALDGAHAGTAARHRRAARRTAYVPHGARRARRSGPDARGARPPRLQDRRRPVHALAGGVRGLEEGLRRSRRRLRRKGHGPARLEP